MSANFPAKRYSSMHRSKGIEQHQYESVSHDTQNGFSWGVKEDVGTDMKLEM